MIEMLADGAFASELIERTSSSAQVQRIVEASLTPVFLLAAIGAMMNVMNLRLVWIVERIERLEALVDSDDPSDTMAADVAELPVLLKRANLGSVAISLGTAAALMICAIIAVGFVSAFVETRLGTILAAAWIATMSLIFAGLLYFLRETRLATQARRKRYNMARGGD